ncbi:restriction endonuclease subunit S [Selenomonas ruminantium]|uniref:Type I restriction enzyme, S subunit n=1 Tax=Selenomonas ruminantium TaxID=971 RepID=A0A1H4A4V1_SELRU|nr:restriction endonuclease subunit S [Selenomonas ruminantium]SEA30582.1 type I restriction enzyme, S subunit [Selenomonas ruminantium]
MGRKMKDSGVEWIGMIPSEWNVTSLKWLASIQTGNTPSKNMQDVYYANEGIPWIKPENLGENEAIRETAEYLTDAGAECARIMPRNSVYVCCIGSVGKVGYSDKCCSCNQQINAVIFNERMYWKFGYYMTIAQECEYGLYSNGNVVQIINTTGQSDLKCPVPQINEQKLIVQTLDDKTKEIDSARRAIKRSIIEYQNIKQSLITRAVTKGIWGEREMKDSGMDWLPELPIDWESIPAKYLFQNVDVRRLPDDERLTASQKYGIITQAEYMERENAKVVTATKNLSDWKHVEPNDFIISLRSFQGGLEMSEVSGCITWHYIVLRARRKVCHKFYKWLFKSSQYINALQGTCNFIRDGQDLRFSNFSQVPLYIPSLEEQEEIAAYLDEKCSAIDTLIAKKEQLLSELEIYKKSLIYEYVTGKREVPA